MKPAALSASPPGYDETLASLLGLAENLRGLQALGVAQLRHAGDAPTIGLILCQTKDRILAEYSLKDIHKPIGVADYELTRALPAELASSLPSIETIEAELSVDLETEAAL